LLTQKKFYVTNWGRKRRIKMGVEGLTDVPDMEEGDDQAASAGVDPPAVVEEGDLEDAPAVAPDGDDVPDELEPDGPHTPVPPVPEEEDDE
jgi:hypothetical protein